MYSVLWIRKIMGRCGVRDRARCENELFPSCSRKRSKIERVRGRNQEKQRERERERRDKRDRGRANAKRFKRGTEFVFYIGGGARVAAKLFEDSTTGARLLLFKCLNRDQNRRGREEFSINLYTPV